tara:strand:+ start:891 stop:2318 length:1428 start_codon:yes stop_codon:yes gene_type:complete
MITPNIAPRKITGAAATGLFSAAKSSIRRMENVTKTISKSPSLTKEEKLGINYVQFFGSKKNSKILKKSLKSIRDSLVATFAIAKLLRSEVSKNVKLIGEKTKGKRGFFGLGLGGILGIFNLLTNPIVLTVLGIGAGLAGGSILLTFLYANRDKIINFFMDKARGLYDFLMNFVSNVVGDFLGDRVKSPELRNVEIESEENIRKDKIELMKGDDGLSANEAQFQAVENEIVNLRTQISELKSKDVRTTKESNKLKALNARLKELTTGEVTTDVLSQRIFGFKNPTDRFFGDQIRQSLRNEPVFPLKEYASQSNAEKLKTIQSITSKFQRQGNSLDTIKQVYGRALKTNKTFTKDGKERDLTDDERIFAIDMVKLADQLQAGGNSSSAVDPTTFTPSNVNTKIPSSFKESSSSGTTNSDTSGTNLSGVQNPNIKQGVDIASQPVSANSAPSFKDIINFNPDNDFIEYNASLLNIFA